MVKRVVLILGVVGLIAAAILAYMFFKTPDEASQPIQAIPLAISSPTAGSATGSQPTALSATAAPTTAASTETSAEPTTAPVSAQPVIFEIVQDESEARFIINETLRGSPKEVVGTTNQVAGQIAVDPRDPSRSQVGVIQINARTFSTDSDMRNRAVKNRILLTNDYEYVQFTPKQITGLPAQGAVGQPYSFKVIGDLTITDVTREVTFDVTVTATSETRLEGLASLTILYQDFELAIPDAPAVDEVEDTVRLELDFVALPATQS